MISGGFKNPPLIFISKIPVFTDLLGKTCR